jgi:hypothetical protein
MSAEQIKIIFKLDTLSIDFAVHAIANVFQKQCVPYTNFELRGKSVNLLEVPPRLKRAGRTTFHLKGQGFDFQLGSVRNAKLVFLEIQRNNEKKIGWDEWIAQFIANPDFVMAWIADSAYDYWQNAHDPLQFTAVGRSYNHLPMRPSGSPYPLNRMLIDTSANPGRWLFHTGYIEAVGSTMWLGQPFWQLTQANPERVANIPWLKHSYPVPSVMRIEAADHCFTTAEGSSGKLQNDLRALLFPVLNKFNIDKH